MSEYGYAGEILKVDLTNRKVSKLATADYAERFLGGKGLATALYWDMVVDPAGPLDPGNCLICASGPVAGFAGFTASRWLVCGRTLAAEPQTFSYGNLGGRWGIRLKYAGYDAMVVQGKADRPVYIFVHDGAVEIRDASRLWGASAFATEDRLKDELGKGISVFRFNSKMNGNDFHSFSLINAKIKRFSHKNRKKDKKNTLILMILYKH